MTEVMNTTKERKGSNEGEKLECIIALHTHKKCYLESIEALHNTNTK